MKEVYYYKCFLHYIKIGETSYYQRNREAVLNRAKDYFENDKDKKRKSKKKYRELSEKKKNTNKEHGRNKM